MQKKQLFVLSLIGVATYLWAMDKGKQKASPPSPSTELTEKMLELEVSQLPQKAQWAITCNMPMDRVLLRYLHANLATQRQLVHRTIENPATVDRFVYGEFSHDGNKILTTTNDNKIIVWDSNTTQQIRTLTLASPVFQAHYSTNDAMILAYTEHETVAFDTETGIQIRSFSPFGTFSPDGSKIIVLSLHHAIIYDTRSGAQGHTITIPERNAENNRQHFNLARFSYDNSKVMTIPRLLSDDPHYDITDDSNHSVIVWNVQTGRELFTMVTERSISDGSFSPNGDYIVLCPIEGPSLWNGHTGSLIKEFEYYEEKAVFSADSSKLLMIPGYRLRDEQEEDRSDVSEESEESAAEESSESSNSSGSGTYSRASVSDESASNVMISPNYDDNHAHLWDINTQNLLHSFATAAYMREYIASLSANGTTIATILDGGKPALWNALSGEFIFTLPTRTNFVAINPNGNKVITNTDDGQSIALWNFNVEQVQNYLKTLTLKQCQLLQAFGRAIRDTNKLRSRLKNPDLPPSQIHATRDQMATFSGLNTELQRVLRPYITDATPLRPLTIEDTPAKKQKVEE